MFLLIGCNFFRAIDIRTNAGRLLIKYTIHQNNHMSVKKVLLTRPPRFRKECHSHHLRAHA